MVYTQRLLLHDNIRHLKVSLNIFSHDTNIKSVKSFNFSKPDICFSYMYLCIFSNQSSIALEIGGRWFDFEEYQDIQQHDDQEGESGWHRVDQVDLQTVVRSCWNRENSPLIRAWLGSLMRSVEKNILIISVRSFLTSYPQNFVIHLKELSQSSSSLVQKAPTPFGYYNKSFT